MNPNSQNQRWSKWVWFVVPGIIKSRPFREVVDNISRFGRKGFGSSSQMRVRQTGRGYIIELLTEGAPVHDPTYRKYMDECWKKFFTNGFGQGTTVKMSAKLMAGSPQNGQPSEQMLIIPPLRVYADG